MGNITCSVVVAQWIHIRPAPEQMNADRLSLLMETTRK
jgi:hypothetical protein